MYVNATHEFRLEAEVQHHADGSVTVWATEVDSDGGMYHTPNDIFEPEVMATFPFNEIAGLSDQVIAQRAAGLVS